MTVVRGICVAVGVCLLVLLGGTSAWAVAPSPVPMPTDGTSVPTGWTCQDTSDSATPPVTGSSCAVTAWGTQPVAPAPPAGTSSVSLTDDQFGVIGFGVGLLVLLASAHVVGSWRSA